MAKSGGTRANLSGKRLEEFVADKLEELGYEFIETRLFFPAHELEQPIYTRQIETGIDIYGKTRRVDLILYHPELWLDCLVVQCKWQSSGGSVHEKYPFEVLSIQQGEFDTIILLDGGGYHKGAKQWLLNQAGKNRLKHVFDMGEFSRFASQGRL